MASSSPRSACSYMDADSQTSHSISDVVRLTQERQKEVLFTKLVECFCQMETDPYTLGGAYCNRTWDNVMCWSDTPAGTTAKQPCPAYINNFKTYQLATRTCLHNGTWYVHPALSNNSGGNGWTNYSACASNSTFSENRKGMHDVPDLMLKHLSGFRMMYNIGYALSLVSLVFAAIIMVYFRRLHCSRNAIHLNLFVSFMLRAVISLARDNLMVHGLGFPGDVGYNESSFIYFREGSHWGCRAFFTVFQYVVAASYVWIFMEGVYLHMYIFVSVFVEKTSVTWYILLGWALPVVIVTPWAIGRIMLDNTLCWNTHNNHPGLIWIIKGPIMATIVLNLLFFINIVRVLFTKLSTTPTLEAKRYRYRRLARSTLFLIPLFGVYYIVFTLPLETMDDTVKFVMIFIEMFFNSYQGFVIAVVLCFVNSEVRAEIKRAWKLKFQMGGGYSKTTYVTKKSFVDPQEASTTMITGSKTNQNGTFELHSPKVLITNRDRNVNQCGDANVDRHSRFMNVNVEAVPSSYQQTSTDSSDVSTNQNDTPEIQHVGVHVDTKVDNIVNTRVDNVVETSLDKVSYRFIDDDEGSVGVSPKLRDDRNRRNWVNNSNKETSASLEESRYLLVQTAANEHMDVP